MEVRQVAGEEVRTRKQGGLALWSQMTVRKKWQALPKVPAALDPIYLSTWDKAAWGGAGSVAL